VITYVSREFVQRGPPTSIFWEIYLALNGNVTCVLPWFAGNMYLSGLIQISPPPMPPRVLVDFVVLPPGHGRSVTDAHEAQLRCPDDVSGDIGRNSTNLPRPWSPREFSPSEKIPMVEPGIEPGTSCLVVRDSDH